MPELQFHYTPAEQGEIFEAWANALMRTDPELAEGLVKMIVDNSVKRSEI